MPPRTRGGSTRRRTPVRGRSGRGRGPNRENTVEGPDVEMTCLSPATTQPARDSAVELVDVLRTVVRTLSGDQPANDSPSTREARCLQDFKRGDPQTFKGTSDDPTEAQLWLSSIETVFRLKNFPEDQKVERIAFMLRADAHVRWRSTQELIRPGGVRFRGQNSRRLLRRRTTQRTPRLANIRSSPT